MSCASQSTRYVENDFRSRSPEWLVTLVYEALLTSLRKAEVQIETGDIEGKAASLSRAGAIVGELISSLDTEGGGDMAVGLASLYAYFSLEIMNIGRSPDTVYLSRLIRMVEELHGAWTVAAEKVPPRGVGSGRTQAVAAA